MKKKILLSLLAVGSVATLTACGNNSNNGNGFDGLTFNVTFGNLARSLTYQKGAPLLLADGKTTVNNGEFKPVWSKISNDLGINFKDETKATESATNMIKTAAANGFATSNIYGGNSIAETLQNYGRDGYFVNLLDYKEQMPNFTGFLEANPDIEKAITTYDGKIYHIPYTAEIGEIARNFILRESWVIELLDGDGTGLDTTTTVTENYTPVWTGNDSNRVSIPHIDKETGFKTEITKTGGLNAITEQNKGDMNGAGLVQSLKDYIDTSYPGMYENPSELFLGAKAAYDIDELVALLRCVKANPKFLTGNKATDVVPLFVRQSDYRDDLLRFTTYFYGERAYGSDSYGSRFYLDGNGDLTHSYNTDYMYNTLTRLKEMQAEGLIHGETFDSTKKDKDDYRKKMIGADQTSAPTYGFMTYDWINSTASDSMNKTWLDTDQEGNPVQAPANGQETDTLKQIDDVWHVLRTDMRVVLPPVSKINNQWQYFVDNSRVIKPDGWSISKKASSEKQILDAVKLFDYMFSKEGNELINYGFGSDMGDNAMVETFDENNKDTYFQINGTGTKYLKFNEWTVNTAKEVANGDISTFLRDWVGALVAVGFVKTIGGVAQTDSYAAQLGASLIQESTTNIPTYAGLDKNTNALPTGPNQNYFKLAPPTFSMTKSQKDVVIQLEASTFTDVFFDSMYAYVFGVINDYDSGNYKNFYKDATAYKNMFKSKDFDRYLMQYQNAYNAVYRKDDK